MLVPPFFSLWCGCNGCARGKKAPGGGLGGPLDSWVLKAGRWGSGKKAVQQAVGLVGPPPHPLGAKAKGRRRLKANAFRSGKVRKVERLF